MIKILDTLSGKKENLPEHRPLRIFVCGPTVYDVPHIGHARTYIAFVAIVKYLKSRDIKTFYLQNITDIDDKVIQRAKEQKIPALKLAKKFEKEYYLFEKALGIKVDKHARATKHILQILKQIKTLIKKEVAYIIEDDGYYFDITKFADYGKLSRRTSLQAEDATSRIDENVRKRNRGDFCLWKFTESRINADSYADSRGKISARIINGEPAWRSPWGWGRPGWHIEDTAITQYFFGPQYEIHGGGVDLKFPHHEAEIAQQESASGKKPLVKIWMHTGALLVDGQKMSKSLNNFVTAEDFLKTNSPETLRLMILMNHYRSPLNFKNEVATQSANAFNKIQNSIYRLYNVKLKSNSNLKIKELLASAEKEFHSAMEDDFNTPKALASIFELINRTDLIIKQMNSGEAKEIAGFIIKTLASLGLKLNKKLKIPLKITAKIKKRELYRVNKQFIHADALRKEIEALGYIIEDTPAGFIILRND